MEAQAGIHAQVLRHLELLSSLELQAQYQRDVEIAHVPAELVCVWFDDLDLPASAPKLFVGENVESVRAFSDLLERAAHDLEGLGLSELHSHPLWLQVVAEARILLQRLRDVL